MSITIKNRYLIIAILIAFLGIGGLGWYLGARKTKSVLNELKSAKNEIISYKAKIGQDSVIIVLSEQEVVSQKKAKQALEITNRDLRALNMKLTTDISKLQFRIDTLLKVKHDGKIVVVIDTVTEMPENALLLPFGFNKTDQYMTLDGMFDENADLEVGLKMNADVDVIMGYDKTTKKPTIAVYTDNPYIKTIGIRSFKTDTPRPKKYGIGLFTGYGISIKHPTDPSIIVGAGFSYNFIRF